MSGLSLIQIFGFCLFAALVLQAIAWLIAVRLKRVDIVDSFWGITFLVIIITLLIIDKDYSPSVILVSVLVTIWGMRLAAHIFSRFWRTKKQDIRYTEIMAGWPNNRPYLQALPRIFLLQAVLATLISLPVILIHMYQPDLSLLIWIGAVVWLVGFWFEVVADRQLAHFVAKGTGKTMSKGLWRYSRHPNYFGEIVMWLGISLIALWAPNGWLGLVGLATITVLIVFISGIPPAERRGQRRPDWAEYKRKTSILIPWPPAE
ncbi:MAG: DUF1295 domain-containing protein [Candidatus Saccharimonas sp.]